MVYQLYLLNNYDDVYEALGSTHNKISENTLNVLGYMAEKYVKPYAKLKIADIARYWQGTLPETSNLYFRIESAWGAVVNLTCYYAVRKLAGIDTAGFSYKVSTVSVDKDSKLRNLTKTMYDYKAEADRFLMLIAKRPLQDDPPRILRDSRAVQRGVFPSGNNNFLV
mgnify:CR=1 FL=1